MQKFLFVSAKAQTSTCSARNRQYPDQNLEKLNDVTDWLALIDGPVTPEIEDPGFAGKAAELLPEGALNADSWKIWTDAVKDATGAKGKSLFMPLRLALTGQPRGPEMAVLLPLIDRTKIIARLNGQAA